MGLKPMAPLLAAALVRLGLWAMALARTGTRVITSGDTASYLEPGRNLLWHGRFVTAGLPEVDRTPGYPLFLAATSLAGPALAALAQIALGLLCVWLVARLARAVFASERVALCAAWLFAFEPVAVIYSVRLLSETLFLLFLLLSLERLVVFLQARSLRALALGGLALTAAIFVRPVGYFLPFALIALFFILFWQEKRWLAWSLAVLLATTLPWLALWQIRNRVETGFGGFSSIAARNLYYYSAAGVLAARAGTTLVDEQRALGYFGVMEPGVGHLSEQTTAAKHILAAHPGIFLRQQVTGSLLVALTPCATDLLKLLGAEDAPERVVSSDPLRALGRMAHLHPGRLVWMALFEAWLLALYLFAARGIVRGGIARPVLALLLSVALYFLAVSGGVQAVGRYRLPVMPELVVLAAAGLCARKTAIR
jgi:4-amino-4-deoxy-L-arabinose transferase-like glycosyltransferase